MNTKAYFTYLRKITNTLNEDVSMTLSNRVVKVFKESINNKQMLIPAAALLQKHISEQYDRETADMLFNRLVEHEVVPSVIIKHDLSTVEGYMRAVEEVMAEMVSGAAIGGSFDGAQSNAAANASGMAAPNGPTKKKNRLEKIYRR